MVGKTKNIHTLKLGQTFFCDKDLEVVDQISGSSGMIKRKKLIHGWTNCIVFKHNARSTGILVEIENDLFVPMPSTCRETLDYTTMYASPAFEYMTISKDHVIAASVYKDDGTDSMMFGPQYCKRMEKKLPKSA